MHPFMLAVVSLALTLLTGCSSCWNPFESTCGSWNPFDQCNSSDQSGGNQSGGNDIPEAPYVDLPPPSLSIHAEEITAIVQEYAVELKNRKRIHLEHAHTYYNEEGIHTIQMEFNSQDIIELCDARKLIIDVSEGMLEELNSNPLLVPEFTNQGFFPYNLEIYIAFDSYYIRYIDPFYIRWICMEDAKILFYDGEVTDNDKNSWHYKKESYNTSRNIVLYQRAAEDRYRAMKESEKNVFGDKRFYVQEPVSSSKIYQ